MYLGLQYHCYNLNSLYFNFRVSIIFHDQFQITFSIQHKQLRIKDLIRFRRNSRVLILVLFSENQYKYNLF